MTEAVEEKPGYEFKAIALLALGFGLARLEEGAARETHDA